MTECPIVTFSKNKTYSYFLLKNLRYIFKYLENFSPNLWLNFRKNLFWFWSPSKVYMWVSGCYGDKYCFQLQGANPVHLHSHEGCAFFPKRRNIHPVYSGKFKMEIITDQQTLRKTWKIQLNFVSLKWDKFWIAMNKQLPQFHI